VLKSFTCGQLLEEKSKVHSAYPNGPKQPIWINSKDTVQNACSLLHKNRIQSAPIYDHNQSKFIGQIDYADLMGHVMKVLNAIPMPDRGTSEFTIMQILKQTSEAGHPLETIEKHRPLVLVSTTSTLLEVVDYFIKQKTHRVVVLDDHTFIGVLSQSSIAALICSKFGLNKPKANQWKAGEMTLEQAGIIEKNVISVNTTATVMEALFQMHVNNISSIAIVENKKVFNTNVVGWCYFNVRYQSYSY
jgi:predicted transcriptional regulator